MYETYDNELEEINEQLTVFLKNKVNDLQRTKLNNLNYEIDVCKKELNITYDKCLKNLEDEIRKKVNASQLRASVNRNGEYDNYNVYSNIGNFCFSEFDIACSKHIHYINKLIDRNFEDSKGIEKALKTALKLKTGNLFLKFRSKDSQDFKNIMRQKLYQNSLWDKMSHYWGDKNSTKKYRDRIADDLFDEIEHLKISELIYSQKNALGFFNELSSFLNIKS